MNKVEKIKKELQQLELQLEKEGSQEMRKPFWRVVGRIKRLHNPPDEIIEQATHIRNKLFDERYNVVMSTPAGLLLNGIGFTICLISLIYFLSINPPDPFAPLVVLFLELLIVLYFSYPFCRLLGGFVSGIGFEGFYNYTPGEVSLKIEYSSYLKAGSIKRQYFFFITFLSEMILSVLLVLLTWVLAPQIVYMPVIISIGMLLFYFGLFRIETGELIRFWRERRIVNEMRQQ